MKDAISNLFVVPMSWLLAVPIVLLDRLLSPDTAELPDWDESCLAGAPLKQQHDVRLATAIGMTAAQAGLCPW
ncbi:hypothetical protein GQ85_37570 [Rhodococcus rhodochrous]|nr:hypothetical protein GQ85_37570 [Rhodococcus rhodochrous]